MKKWILSVSGVKGFSSFWGSEFKKSFKLDFNEYVPGRRYDGLRKLNLNNGEGDPSLNRDLLCYDLMRNNGVRAPRTSYARLYLNGEYWGLYAVIEQIDRTFLEYNFQNDKGNLFKNIGWTELEWLGNSLSDYEESIGLKTNESENDWSGFINLVDVINNTSNTDFKDAIAEVFNVDLYLKTLAIDVATNNWDSYLDHGRNFYMYEDYQSGKFQWIPWDYNLAMGGEFAGGTFEECDFFPDFVAVVKEGLEVDFVDITWPTTVESYSWDFGDGESSDEVNPSHTFAMAANYQVCLTINKPSASCMERVICKTIDVSMPLSDCNSITNGTCPYPADDPIFAQVIDFAPNCCTGDWTVDCQDQYDWLAGNSGFDYKIDLSTITKPLIKRLMDVQEYRELYFSNFCKILDDNLTEERIFPIVDYNGDLIRDAVYEDDNYIWTTEDFEDDLDQGNSIIPEIKKFVTARINDLSEELPTLYNCETEVEPTMGDVVINEFMASNDIGGPQDSEGENDDWIELYNNTGRMIDLSNFYLSDTIDNLALWRFPPGVSIGPDDYLIVWADKDENQGGYHANFKLSSSYENIYLSYGDVVIDHVEYNVQTTLLTSSRIPNGTGDFVIQDATFGFNNEHDSAVSDETLKGVNVHPNPTISTVQVEVHEDIELPVSIHIYDALGRNIKEIRSSEKNTSISVASLQPGLYYIKLVDASAKYSLHKLKVVR